MPNWHRYLRFWRRDARADVDDELAFHLEMREHDLERDGVPREMARREAARIFGDVGAVRDACVVIDERRHRQHTRAEVIGSMWNDIRFAARALRKSPAFATMAVLCIALGICVTTTIFSAVNAILIRPLPYAQADELLAVYGENTPRGYHGTNISYKDYVSWRDANNTLSALGIWTWVTKTISEGESERVPGASVSANLFPLLGVHPILGRNFLPEEEHLNRSDVVLLSYGLWQRRFGGDKSVVGKTISMDGRSHLVAGVMPPNFNFPDRGQFWMPFAYDGPARESHGDRGYAGAIGRLKAGVTVEQAKADLALVSTRLQNDFPNENTGWNADVKTLREDLTGDLRKPLLVFLASVTLVLLIACANVANLMLARGTSRYREMALRTALGAARSRLVRQLLTESLLIAIVGGVIGAALGIWGLQLFRFAFPNDVPFYFTFGADPLAIVFAAAVIILTGALFGVVPALRTTRLDINAALRDGARAGEGRGRARLRNTLVVAEVALSVVLVVCAALLIRSYRAYATTNLGFEEKGILTARITLPERKYDDAARRIHFFTDLEASVRALPGVSIVGSAAGIPFSGWNIQSEVHAEGRSAERPNEEVTTHWQSVFPDFFATIGIQLVRGRQLAATDRDTLAPVVVVNEAFARAMFPNEDPIGKRVKTGNLTGRDPWSTIVGVVRDYRHYRLPQPMGPAMYYTYAEAQSRSQTLVLRTTLADPYALLPSVRAALHALDPQLAMYDVNTMGDVVSQSLWRQRLQGQVLGIFAVLALLLATVGIYGVISYAVAQRTREIGVRVALGAQRSHVLAMVLRQGASLAGTGLAIGIAAAFVVSRSLETLLYGVSATDLVSFAVVPAVLALVTMLATYLPARRATRVDPLIAIRTE
ncbi:MAG TPA: ABC transporter permease [Gemmatimonadaceae bacterium]